MIEPAPTTGPLAGLKVVELGQLIAGPFATKTLADFGAEVIKIEPPGSGDPLRQWRLLHDGTSVWWQVQSRNKHSVALDLRERRRPRHRAPPDRRGRRARRELQARHDGRLGPGVRGPERDQPRPRDAAHQRLRPDRALPRPAGLRRRRRGDGRPAPPHRRAGPRAGARRREHRRHARRAARRDRHADGAAPPHATASAPRRPRAAVR